MCVCVHVFVCVCARAHVCVCVCVCVRARVRAHARAYMRTEKVVACREATHEATDADATDASTGVPSSDPTPPHFWISCFSVSCMHDAARGPGTRSLKLLSLEALST